jgi:putative SOS response-associated peptidase YedK
MNLFCLPTTTQQAPVFGLENNQPVMKLMRWGLIPGRAKDESIGDNLINARAETIAEKTSFKKPFEFQRCLVAAMLVTHISARC